MVGRAGGRGEEEFRSLFLDTGVISQARGSAYAEFDTTKVMVGVYGPRQSELKFGFSEAGRLQCSVKLTSFAAVGLSKQQQTALERSMSEDMRTALTASVQLDKFPKSSVDVYAMVLESGGSDLAVAITAASVALADSGIELFDLVPACYVVKRAGSLLLDPSSVEEAQQEASALMAFMPSCNEVTQVAMQGCWGEADSREVLELCMGACVQLKAAMRGVLLAAAVGGGEPS